MGDLHLKYELDVIERETDNPQKSRAGLYQGMINDARTYYENGIKSKEWFEMVERILGQYL